MNNNDSYNFGVNSGTRNHKGAFVRHTAYKLVEVNEAGWAVICQDQATCHYVDPSSLRKIDHPNGNRAGNSV